MDKNAIFNEFKKTKEIEKEVEIVPEEKKDTEHISVEIPENKDIISVPKYKNNKRRNRKKHKKNNELKKEEISVIKDDFEKWKEEFLLDETNRDFMNLLQFYRDKNFNVFSDDEFLRNKYEHPQMKTVVLDPTLLEINAGKGGNCYLIKPLYADEYNYFLKNIGTREEKPEEFMKYSVKTGVLYPEFTDAMLDKTSAGTILSLYNYILQFSDLTKTIKILEV